MKEFSLVYKNISLNITCDEYIELLIKEHFQNHLTFSQRQYNPTYSLIIAENLNNYSGTYFKMIDKWFDNATLDCYINNLNKTCYATNFQATSLEYKNLLIQYFVANVFNRFLEIEGYLGVHSSCVSKNGEGILFVAGRNSGKTTCMLNLMNAGFDSVTNDKIALKYENDCLFGYGIAQSVSIRFSPQFCAQVQNKKYVDLALQRGINIKGENMLEGNNMVLKDTELAQLNHVNQMFDTKIKCIINPSYDPQITKLIFNKLTNEEANNLIIEQYMSLVHDTTSFLRNIQLKHSVDRNATFQGLSNIPFYSCKQNENTIEEFIDQMKSLILKK